MGHRERGERRLGHWGDCRRRRGRGGGVLPFRPDHGHDLLSDIGRGTHPGYPLIGRMRGLAELRGVCAGLNARERLAVSDKIGRNNTDNPASLL